VCGLAKLLMCCAESRAAFEKQLASLARADFEEKIAREEREIASDPKRVASPPPSREDVDAAMARGTLASERGVKAQFSEKYFNKIQRKMLEDLERAIRYQCDAGIPELEVIFCDGSNAAAMATSGLKLPQLAALYVTEERPHARADVDASPDRCGCGGGGRGGGSGSVGCCVDCHH